MKVNVTSFTVGEYCEQLGSGQIVVNRDYQRSSKVWPSAAKSYLLDTILLGFPLPKLTLYQKTDPDTRRTIKEIVDGQQRSEAICQYLSGRYRLSPKSPFAGRRFSQLDEEDRIRLLEYPIYVDLLTAATPEEVRLLFRRINSYTVPLNRQETRHAIFQGEFKWFINELAERYATALKNMGVATEAQLTRMADAELFGELILALIDGIKTASPAAITELYERYDREFPHADEMRRRFASAFDLLVRMDSLHGGPLMKPYHFYSLFLAAAHCSEPAAPLLDVYPIEDGVVIDIEVAEPNLGTLAAIADAPETVENAEAESGEVAEQLSADLQFEEFRKASAEGTNIEERRKTRFRWFCRALHDPSF